MLGLNQYWLQVKMCNGVLNNEKSQKFGVGTKSVLATPTFWDRGVVASLENPRF